MKSHSVVCMKKLLANSLVSIAKDSVFLRKKTLNLRGKIFDLSVPAIMGVLNLTPDSFFSGSRFTELNEITDKTGQMLAEGAAFIDVGGYSSRPGADNLSENEETDRVLSVIESLVKDFADVNISIDTFRAGVAEKAVNAGAVIVNDISGGSLDEKMFETVARLQVPYVLMHLRGNPQTMTQLTDYQDLLKEIFIYFEEKIVVLKDFGVKDVVLDLGFGFAKNITQNFTLLQNLHYFDLLGLPMLVGISRKSMIYKTLGVSPEEALNGTTVLNTVALWQGASILRVHDVKEAAETVKLISKLQNV
jgi:dihydropteroate synthase